jgi:serine/threonine-protein kinase
VSPEEWQKLSAVLDQLLELPEAEQAPFLDRLRAADPRLCQEIESLLQQRHPTERLEAPPHVLMEALPRNGSDGVTPLSRTPVSFDGSGEGPRDPTAARLPEIAGYEVLELIGRGGMGVVYKARQIALDRIVALKMLRPGVESDDEEFLRFRTEAEASAQLQHPHIVPIYEVGEQDGRPYLALEYVAGGGLDRFLGGAPQPPRLAAGLLKKLADAMHYAHSRGILHRDLKPANVLLSGEWRVASGEKTAVEAGEHDPNPSLFATRHSPLATIKITDFGLAKRLHSDSGRTQTGAVLGTPSYMAPEQAAGKKEIGPAVDIYALGAILYEMLTGRPPFRGLSTYDTLLQVQQNEPVAPSRLQPKIPRDLETICLKCLAKDPQQRYASAALLADDLGRFLAGAPVAARPAGRIERTWRWCRRKPKDAVLIAVGLLVVVLGIVAYLWLAGADQDRRERQARASTEAETDRAEAERLWDQAKSAPVGDLLPWERALAAAQRAKDVIDQNPVDEPTRRRVEQTRAGVVADKQTAEKDARMTKELDKLAFSQLEITAGHGESPMRPDLADARYQQVFLANYEIDLNQPEDAEARIRVSAIKPHLLAALDAWIPLRPDESARRRLADLVNRLSEPDDFRRDLRESLVKQDHDRLRQLAKRDLSALPPRVVFDVGLALFNGQDFEEAAALLQPAQRLHPDDFGIAFLLAFCVGELNPPRLDDELRFYTAAAAIQPDNTLARNGLGDALCLLGKVDDAVAEWNIAHRLDPTDPYPLANLATVQCRERRLDEAVAQYRAALLLSDRQPAEQAAVLHHNLGFALWKQGKLDEAVVELRGAVQRNPQYTDAYYHLGWALIQNGQFQEALDVFQEAKRLRPPPERQFASWDAEAKQADRLRLLGDQIDALADGRKKPADAEEEVEFAEVCFYKRRLTAAVRLFQDAFAASPQLAATYRNDAARAAVLAGTDKGGAATEQQRAALRTQARDWLRTDLQAWTKAAESADAQQRKAAARQMRVWQYHVDFAGVRDETELTKLPADEQKAWRTFWADVAALVERAEKR